jgi:hypothetical protein
LGRARTPALRFYIAGRGRTQRIENFAENGKLADDRLLETWCRQVRVARKLGAGPRRDESPSARGDAIDRA